MALKLMHLELKGPTSLVEIKISGSVDGETFKKLRSLLGMTVSIAPAGPGGITYVSGWDVSPKPDETVDPVISKKVMEESLKKLREMTDHAFLGKPGLTPFNDSLIFNDRDREFIVPTTKAAVKMECPQCHRDRRADEIKCWWCERVF